MGYLKGIEGNYGKCSSDGRTRTSGETDRDYAGKDGTAYAVPVNVTVTGADDVFLLIRNLSSTHDIYVDRILLGCDAPAAGEYITVGLDVTGTAAGGGSAVPAVCLEGGKTPLSTAEIETYQDPEITGLTVTDTAVVFGMYDNYTADVKLESPIKLGASQGMTLMADSGTDLVVGTVFIRHVKK